MYLLSLKSNTNVFLDPNPPPDLAYHCKSDVALYRSRSAPSKSILHFILDTEVKLNLHNLTLHGLYKVFEVS